MLPLHHGILTMIFTSDVPPQQLPTGVQDFARFASAINTPYGGVGYTQRGGFRPVAG